MVYLEPMIAFAGLCGTKANRLIDDGSNSPNINE